MALEDPRKEEVKSTQFGSYEVHKRFEADCNSYNSRSRTYLMPFFMSKRVCIVITGGPYIIVPSIPLGTSAICHIGVAVVLTHGCHTS